MKTQVLCLLMVVAGASAGAGDDYSAAFEGNAEKRERLAELQGTEHPPALEATELLEEKHAAPARIGVYDSRAVAVAAVGSAAYYDARVKPLEDAFAKAKADGDEDRVRELEPRVWERRKQTHRQGFGTASVDEMLDFIADDLPGIREAAGVEELVSKWDQASLSKHAAVERVDVTMELVEAFHPNPRSLQHARSIQEQDPMPMDVLEEHLEREAGR